MEKILKKGRKRGVLDRIACCPRLIGGRKRGKAIPIKK